jgi:hypothetical protein
MGGIYQETIERRIENSPEVITELCAINLVIHDSDRSATREASEYGAVEGCLSDFGIVIW